MTSPRKPSANLSSLSSLGSNDSHLNETMVMVSQIGILSNIRVRAAKLPCTISYHRCGAISSSAIAVLPLKWQPSSCHSKFDLAGMFEPRSAIWLHQQLGTWSQYLAVILDTARPSLLRRLFGKGAQVVFHDWFQTAKACYISFHGLMLARALSKMSCFILGYVGWLFKTLWHTSTASTKRLAFK